MLDLCRVPNHTSHVVHVGNLLLVPVRLKHAPTPGRSPGDQRQTSSAIVLGHLILPPSRLPWSREERFWLSGYIATSAYCARIPACDRYVQCLLMGPTHRYLTDTSGGYNLVGADFPHTTPWPSQPTISTFNLRAPPGLRLNNPT
jgi:hypothetical protein